MLKANTPEGEDEAKLAAARAEIEVIVARYAEEHGIGKTVVPGLSVGLATSPIPPSA